MKQRQFQWRCVVKSYMHLCANINLSPHSLHIVFFIVYRHKNGNCTGTYTKQAHIPY